MADDKGVYVLQVKVHDILEVGALGKVEFSGVYLYVGSALGPGGFKRVDRHYRTWSKASNTLRWHIDYLLKAGIWRKAYIAATEERVECELAKEIGDRIRPALNGFGSSDCRCVTHLFHLGNNRAEDIVPSAIRACGLIPAIYQYSQ